VYRQVDLTDLRLATALFALVLLLYGLIWEND
jgi:heme A synthase